MPYHLAMAPNINVSRNSLCKEVQNLKMERMTGLARLRSRLPTRPRSFKQFTGLFEFAYGEPTFSSPWGLLLLNGADDGARTRYLHLGKVALYQMSYIRKWCLRSESNQRHEDFQSSALPTELQRQKEKWRPGTGSNRRPLA